MSSESKKQERDYTPEVDLLLPQATALAKVRRVVRAGSDAQCYFIGRVSR
jgi:hypothetical protein